ncbi:hypothetical protein ACJJTC_015165 [Scirpophaga incertulas]
MEPAIISARCRRWVLVRLVSKAVPPSGTIWNHSGPHATSSKNATLGRFCIFPLLSRCRRIETHSLVHGSFFFASNIITLKHLRVISNELITLKVYLPYPVIDKKRQERDGQGRDKLLDITARPYYAL